MWCVRHGADGGGAQLVLVIGDLHIPQRADDLPAKFKTMLVPGKIQHILCTGNLCTKEVYEYLRTVSSDIHLVRGDFDDKFRDNVPEYEVVTLGQFKVGLIHGHQIVPWGDKESLALWQRKLDVDVLVSGHTHMFDAYEFDGKYFLNPGSATGAFSPMRPTVVPTFVLMDIQGDLITSYIYTYEEVKDASGAAKMDVVVKKKEYRAPSSA